MKTIPGNNHAVSGHGDHMYFSVNQGFMMKTFLIFGFVLLSACSSINDELQNALALGEIKELNQLDTKIDKQLLLRLYRSPLYQEDCFKETHGVCRYTYFLSVSTYDEYPVTNIYKLKTQGEIISIRWENTTMVDTAKLKLTFNRYTNEALKNNKTLKNIEKRIYIEVNAVDIKESE